MGSAGRDERLEGGGWVANGVVWSPSRGRRPLRKPRPESPVESPVDLLRRKRGARPERVRMRGIVFGAGLGPRTRDALSRRPHRVRPAGPLAFHGPSYESGSRKAAGHGVHRRAVAPLGGPGRPPPDQGRPGGAEVQPAPQAPLRSCERHPAYHALRRLICPSAASCLPMSAAAAGRAWQGVCGAQSNRPRVADASHRDPERGLVGRRAGLREWSRVAAVRGLPWPARGSGWRSGSAA